MDINENLKTIIIYMLIILALTLFLYVFIESMYEPGKRQEGDAILQFAMTISVSVSTFLGALLGISTKKQIDTQNPQAAKPKFKFSWKFNAQFAFILTYMSVLSIAFVWYLFNDETEAVFVRHLFTTTTGLILGVIAIVFSPIKSG